jgi:hypothetical protein
MSGTLANEGHNVFLFFISLDVMVSDRKAAFATTLPICWVA